MASMEVSNLDRVVNLSLKWVKCDLLGKPVKESSENPSFNRGLESVVT